MKHQYIKFLSIFAFFSIFLAGATYAQTPNTNYFIESSHTRNSLNPALRPNSSYVGMPFLSGVAIDYKTNTFNLDNFTSKVGGERVTFMHHDVSVDDFMSNISEDNYLSTSLGYDIFSMGFYKGESFWNINMGVKTQIDANLPKNLFRLAKEGFGREDLTSYDLKDISATANSYLELGIGYSRPFLNNNLIVGTKAKLLGGIANFDLQAERFDLKASATEWRAQSRVRFDASAPGIEADYNRDGMFEGFDFGNNWGSPTGFGFGFDLGAVYDFKDMNMLPDAFKNLKASMSFTDIGFISWSKKNSVHLVSPDDEIVVIPSDYTIHTDGSTSIEDIFDDVIDDLEEVVNLKEHKKGGRTTALRTTMNIGLEYSFLNNKLSTGLLYSNRFGRYFNTQELTLSGNYRPNSWFATSLSYSFMHSNFNTLGGALYLTPSKVVHFFVVSDYIISHVSPEYIPSTSNALNVQFGISIPM